MTKLVGGFALVTAVLAAGAAQAHDVNMPARQRTLSVSGQAAVQVVPDEVELVVGVETDDKELERAKADNDRRLEAALGATRRHGVAPEKVATDYLNVEPRWDTRDDERVFLGYWVRKNLTLTLRDLSQFDALLSELLTAGVTHVHDIEFRTTELRKHRDEARRLAAVAVTRLNLAEFRNYESLRLEVDGRPVVLTGPKNLDELRENLSGLDQGAMEGEELEWMRSFGKVVHG